MYKRSRQGETSKLSSLHCARDVTNICGNVDVDVASGISASSGERTKGMVGGCENDETWSFYEYMRVIASWVVRQETSGTHIAKDDIHCAPVLGLDNSCCHGYASGVDNWTIEQ
jgi:hypothetical protein